MRFVAGRGAVATEMLAGAPWWKAIGKMLLVGAPWWLSCCWPGDATEQDAAGRGAVAERLQRGGAVVEMLAEAPWHSITLDEGAGADTHREAAVRIGKKLASGSSGARRAEAGRQKPAGAAILCNCCCPNSGCRACILASLWLLRGPPVFGT